MNLEEKKKLISDIEASDPVNDLYAKAIKVGFWHEQRDPSYKLEQVAACMAAAGISTVSEGEQVIARYSDELEAFMKSVYGDRVGYRWEVSPGFIMALAIIYDQPDVFTAERLEEMGWDGDPITQVRGALHSAGRVQKD
ncbi:hypothetical protein [Xanthomonas vesicatoria]|uniref:Uncharacterized protein n=1 Tax=Xanthomonas vesicatoria ATCC 35937 TaxID=925775 RepID=F0BHL9_9XANT|nr:hypothetical protein [Xanthomonas vesicatoria]APP74211.1 hypothetical protein BJD12_01855 [Xanthomonas vesicatoria ATCC 35937]EGD08022.1 hypothetical protein XVE_3761 [Xanthomonas vesicatoria ATCC 35937]KTF31019.1 hypothetical protein LMG919_20200 [Xanthomonas vesicatoria]KTF34213.1 hypothetical protein LMG920_06890 [Xanthomonas vesicatoria]MCC8558679.1 hypothetical protein [Xanthomonas vesicatoria]